MLYVGMDVSSKSFVVHVINEKREVILKKEIKPTRQGLRGLITELGSRKKLVVYEAGNQMRWIWDTLKKMKDDLGEEIEVHVVHPNVIKWINESSGKTDKVDAKKLAELARCDLLPKKVHVVEGVTRQMRSLGSSREGLLRKRVSLMNELRGYLKQEGVQLEEAFFKMKEWEEYLKKTKMSEEMRCVMEGYLVGIEGLVRAEKLLTDRLLKLEDERTHRLETIPGIGKLSSRILVGAIDQIERFEGSKSLAKYGALAPRIYQSGDTVKLGRIDTNGRMEVRRAMLQCAHAVMRSKSKESEPLREFQKRVEKKRGKKVAIVALSRKMLTTVYGVWKSGKEYDYRKVMHKEMRKAA